VCTGDRDDERQVLLCDKVPRILLSEDVYVSSVCWGVDEGKVVFCNKVLYVM
jgi:hypothetical protein